MEELTQVVWVSMKGTLGPRVFLWTRLKFLTLDDSDPLGATGPEPMLRARPLNG